MNKRINKPKVKSKVIPKVIPKISSKKFFSNIFLPKIFRPKPKNLDKQPKNLDKKTKNQISKNLPKIYQKKFGLNTKNSFTKNIIKNTRTRNTFIGNFWINFKPKFMDIDSVSKKYIKCFSIYWYCCLFNPYR